LAAGVLAGGYKIWQVSLDAREAANRIAKDTCSRAVVQFLDGTVAFAGFRLARDSRGQAPAAAHLYVRLHQRRFRTRAGLHRAGRPTARSRGPGGQPLVNAFVTRKPQHRPAHPFELLRRCALTPDELVARAAAAGVEVLALTDHDTVAGLEAAAQCNCVGMRLVPGVEISASWRAQSIHVLGLWIDPASAELCRELRTQGERRSERMRKMCARLKNWDCRAPNCSPP
jgi:hypothetical protein